MSRHGCGGAFQSLWGRDRTAGALSRRTRPSICGDLCRSPGNVGKRHGKRRKGRSKILRNSGGLFLWHGQVANHGARRITRKLRNRHCCGDLSPPPGTTVSREDRRAPTTRCSCGDPSRLHGKAGGRDISRRIVMLRCCGDLSPLLGKNVGLGGTKRAKMLRECGEPFPRHGGHAKPTAISNSVLPTPLIPGVHSQWLGPLA